MSLLQKNFCDVGVQEELLSLKSWMKRRNFAEGGKKVQALKKKGVYLWPPILLSLENGRGFALGAGLLIISVMYAGASHWT